MRPFHGVAELNMDRQDGNWEGEESFQDAKLLRGGKDFAEGGFSLSACGDAQAGNPHYIIEKMADRNVRPPLSCWSAAPSFCRPVLRCAVRSL